MPLLSQIMTSPSDVTPTTLKPTAIAGLRRRNLVNMMPLSQIWTQRYGSIRMMLPPITIEGL